jgi:hypothetical protein
LTTSDWLLTASLIRVLEVSISLEKDYFSFFRVPRYFSDASVAVLIFSFKLSELAFI